MDGQIEKTTVKTLNGENQTGLFPINLQLFAEGGDGGNTDGGDNAGNGENGNIGANDGNGEQKGNNPLSAEALDKLIQSRVDKITAEMGKKNANLQKELDALKKEKLTEEEIRKLDDKKRQQELDDREKALTDKENRLYAIRSIKENELDDGSDKSLELIDFVMGKDQTEIDTKVKAFKSLVDRFVSSKVEQTFKANGRNPNGGGNHQSDDSKNTTYAEKLGKQRAEIEKKSNDIMKHYLGGNR